MNYEPLERIFSRCIFYLGKDVVIQWLDPNDDWPTYRLVAIDAEKQSITVRGIDLPDGSGTHDGSEFIAPIADVLSIADISDWQP